MRDPITAFDIDSRKGRTYLLGLTDIGDWKLLAVYDDEQDIKSWCDRIGENGPSFREWFAARGLVSS